MIRGTTPTHIFNTPLNAPDIKEVQITYAQNDDIVLTKTTTDCTLEGKQIRVTLTQQDTFAFASGDMVQIQLRVLTHSGLVYGTTVQLVSVSKCLDEEVLE